MLSSATFHHADGVQQRDVGFGVLPLVPRDERRVRPRDEGELREQPPPQSTESGKF